MIADGPRGLFIKTPAPQIIEIIALAGPDFAVIDAEHAPFDRVTLDLMLLAGRAAGLPLLVRVADARASSIGGALDLGAAGVMVPHIASVEMARAAVANARYRGGTRGFSSAPTSSCIVSVATKSPSSPCSSSRLCILAVVRLCTATVCPCRAMLRARLRPMVDRPVTPMVAVGFAIVCTVCVLAAPTHIDVNGVKVPGDLSRAGLEDWAAGHSHQVICNFDFRADPGSQLIPILEAVRCPNRGGGPGVKRAIDILRSDLTRSLKLLGCSSVAGLDRSYVGIPSDWSSR
jgi:hypothetical protein